MKNDRFFTKHKHNQGKPRQCLPRIRKARNTKIQMTKSNHIINWR